MPYTVVHKGGKYRVALAKKGHPIARNRAGTPLDGKGHTSFQKAWNQVKAINAREHGYAPHANGSGPAGHHDVHPIPKGMKQGKEHGRKIGGKYRYVPRRKKGSSTKRRLVATTKGDVNKARRKAGLAPRK